MLEQITIAKLNQNIEQLEREINATRDFKRIYELTCKKQALQERVRIRRDRLTTY